MTSYAALILEPIWRNIVFAMAVTELRPKVYLDVVIGDNRAGRIVFSLWSDLAPKLAENFRKAVPDI